MLRLAQERKISNFHALFLLKSLDFFGHVTQCVLCHMEDRITCKNYQLSSNEIEHLKKGWRNRDENS